MLLLFTRFFQSHIKVITAVWNEAIKISVAGLEWAGVELNARHTESAYIYDIWEQKVDVLSTHWQSSTILRTQQTHGGLNAEFWSHCLDKLVNFFNLESWPRSTPHLSLAVMHMEDFHDLFTQHISLHIDARVCICMFKFYFVYCHSFHIRSIQEHNGISHRTI